jgi:hypothetical protein
VAKSSQYFCMVDSFRFSGWWSIKLGASFYEQESLEQIEGQTERSR